MDERKYQLAGLLGFIVSGIFFVIAAIKSGDTFTILGSVGWVVSCVIWIIPLLKPPRG